MADWRELYKATVLETNPNKHVSNAVPFGTLVYVGQRFGSRAGKRRKST